MRRAWLVWILACGCTADTAGLQPSDESRRDAAGRADAPVMPRDAGPDIEDAAPVPDPKELAREARAFCERSFAATAPRLAACTGVGVDYLGEYLAFSTRAQCARIETGVRSGRLLFEREAVERCLAALAGAPCPDTQHLWLASRRWPPGLESCDGIVTSNQGACLDSRDCGLGRVCDDKPSLTGACTYRCLEPIELPSPDLACDWLLNFCPVGYGCEGASREPRSGRCVVLPRIGEPCLDPLSFPECEAGGACNSTTGLCETFSPPSCTAAEQQDCRRSDARCEITSAGPECIALARVGDPCGSRACSVGTYCDYATVRDRLCVPYARLGEACRGDQPTRLCIPGLECSVERGDGTCQDPELVVRAPVGAPCSRVRECASGRCIDRTCAPALPPLVADGGRCSFDSDCQSFDCDDGVCGPSEPICPPPPG